MELLKLTGIGFPELEEGKPQPLYIDSERIVYIERALVHTQDYNKRTAYNELMSSLYDEMERIEGQVRGIQNLAVKLGEENRVGEQQWHLILNAANDLKVAYNLLNTVKPPFERPPIACSTIGLALISDNGQQLSRVHVLETPEQIVAKLEL